MRRIAQSAPLQGGVALGVISLALILAANPALVQSFQMSVIGLSGQNSGQRSSSLNPYWYGGACTNESKYLSNTGVLTSIYVRSQYVSGFLAFWTSESFSNNIWAQVGYYIYEGSAPVGFYQIWNLSSRTEISSATTSVTQGLHSFSFELSHDGIVHFDIDGVHFASYDLGHASSGNSYPVCSLSEEGYAQKPFGFSPITFKVALQVLRSGSWTDVSSATSFGNSWGIQGQMQNTSLAQNELVVGGNLAPLLGTSLLWS